MATIVDYQYIPEVSTLDALHNLASDTTNWYSQELPWVNTFLINWANQITNIPEWEWWSWIAWWSTNVSWSASDNDTVAWSSWNIYLPDWTALAVSSWNTGNMSWTTYIYYDRENNAVATTTSASASVGENKILLCVASPVSWSWKKAEFQAFGTNDQSTFIYASNIAANTITGNEIAANSIKAAQIDSDAITTSKINAWAVTASKITVTQLSDIDSDLWSITAGTITWTTIIAWSTSSSWIKLYPYSSSQWRLDFYYNGNVIWYMYWDYSSAAWWSLVRLNWNAILLDWDVYILYRDTFDMSQGMLRIPVWNNLYN